MATLQRILTMDTKKVVTFQTFPHDSNSNNNDNKKIAKDGRWLKKTTQ